jgi:serine/threonine protein phosphatase PrpC
MRLSNFNQLELNKAREKFLEQKPQDIKEVISSFSSNSLKTLKHLLGPLGIVLRDLSNHLDNWIQVDTQDLVQLDTDITNIMKDTYAVDFIDEIPEPSPEPNTYIPDPLDSLDEVPTTNEADSKSTLETQVKRIPRALPQSTQTSSLCALYNFFNDKVRLAKILADKNCIESKNFVDNSEQTWQSSSISISGAHTPENSDVILNPQNKKKVLAAVADGVSISLPGNNFEKFENKFNSEQKRAIKQLSDVLHKKETELQLPKEFEQRFEYIALCLGQKVAKAIISNLEKANNDAEIDSAITTELNQLLENHFPDELALEGGSTLSMVLDEGEDIQFKKIGDSPIYYYDKQKKQIICLDQSEHSSVLTEGIGFYNLFGFKGAVEVQLGSSEKIKKSNIGWILVASDGLLGYEKDPNKFVDFLLEKFPSGQKDLDTQTLTQAGLEFAKANNSNDDISISVIKPKYGSGCLTTIPTALLTLLQRLFSKH